MTSLLAFVLCVTVGACATSAPASMPVVTASSAPADDFVPLVYGGVIGVWAPEDAIAELLVGFEREKRALRIERARSDTRAQIAEQNAEDTRKAAESLQWRATWGPFIGAAGGAIATAALLLLGFVAWGGK